MEILTLSVTGTLGMLLAQIAEVFRPWVAQRVIGLAAPRAPGASHVSARPIPLKKAA